MFKPLRKVLVKRPHTAFGEAEADSWHYRDAIDLPRAQAEHDEFVRILREQGVEVLEHPAEMSGLADAIFVHDPALVTHHGAIILKMGKALRCGEEAAMAERLQELGIPILFRLSDDCLLEGGDTLWLDEQTLLVGRGYRSNQAGIDALTEILALMQVKVVAFDLPYWEGPRACFHLQSLISLVDEKKAVVYPPLVPIPLWQILEQRGFTMIEVPSEEFATLGSNVLAIRPGLVLTLANNPLTIARMQRAGIEVLTYQGQEISWKAEGGATCLTRPLWRE